MTTLQPLLLCILDGVGYNPDLQGNAVAQANTPTLAKLKKNSPWNLLTTHGELVGLPAGQMGNSEVGHLTIGAGRTIRQWLTRVTAELADGTAQKSAEWRKFTDPKTCSNQKFHLIGLYSRGGVHSHADHLHSSIEALVQAGANDICLHLISDGRDVAPDSFAKDLEALLKSLPPQAKLSSIVGRYFAMDRDKRWERTGAAYNLITAAQGENVAKDPVKWVKNKYSEGVTDEFLPAAVVSGDTISTNDRVLFFNFREDRMRQLCYALTANNSSAPLSRTIVLNPANVLCFTDYDPALHLPVLFHPVEVNNTLGDIVSAAKMRQIRCAETEKYPHVTYFFNGGRETQLPGEERIMVPSVRDVPTYDLKPEMSAEALTTAILDRWINSGVPELSVVNFANGDMVGHTGCLPAAIKAIETVDRCLEKLLKELLSRNGRAIIFADHGNAELMIDYETLSPCTTHTKFLVPFYAVGFEGINSIRSGGSLRDIAPTALKALGLPQPSEMSGSPLF